MTEPLWIEVAKQIPALAVLVYLVTYFLGHLRQMTQDHQIRMSAMSEEHRASQLAQSSAYSAQNADLVRRVADALDRSTNSQDRLLTELGRQDRRRARTNEPE